MPFVGELARGRPLPRGVLGGGREALSIEALSFALNTNFGGVEICFLGSSKVTGVSSSRARIQGTIP